MSDWISKAARKRLSSFAAEMGRAGRGASKVRGDSAHYRAIRAKRVSVWGYRNVAYYPGPRAEGRAVWFPTSAARDEALETLREDAIAHGLSRTAARAGIYPVYQTLRLLTAEQREELDAQGWVETA